jgi:nitrogen fixation/metabolism regulation signal transduction histidine kinase
MALRPGRALKLPALTSRTTRWLLSLGLSALVSIGLGLLVLLTQATDNLSHYEQNYDVLLWVNGVVAAALLLTIVWGSLRLWMRLRRGQFGARLLVKLAAIFALVGVVPGVLIYTVSYQFVSRSIESWFDVKVEGALAAGLTLGRVTLDTLSHDLTQKARQASVQLTEVSEVGAGVALEKLREQLGASDALLWTGSGRLLASAGSSRFVIRPDKPSAAQVRQARSQGGVVWIEGLDDTAPGGDKARLQALVLVPQQSLVLGEELRLLQVVQDLPPTLVTNALEVQAANREYQERALAREGLRRMYIGTLTLSLFMAVLGAILLAVLLGNQLARPLLLLAQGMRQVAAGDLRPKLALQGKDELGGLTRSFAEMTQQLSDARVAVEQSLRQLDAARGNLQTILDNLTTGVIVLDPQGTILSSNPGATRILRVPVAVYEARPLTQLPQLQDFAAGVLQAFEQLGTSSVTHELDHWQKSFEVHASGQGLSQSSVTLLARGAVLPDSMRLLVFDDISEIVSAERTQAWGEVARRLAHEIKNPLTPIQLSAERLQRRLDGKLPEAEQGVLDKSVRTIVEQVDAMKRLVNEFRDYARLPAAELKALDLNALIGDVLALYAGEGTEQAVIVRELDPACPWIEGDAQQLRQVVHNLLQNAQDACEAVPARPARVLIRTEWQAERQRVRLLVQDSGPGFEPHILQRAFEPYVTTKSKGTGLGLAVVKKIADDHRARIELGNVMRDGLVAGAQVSLSFKVDNKPSGT